MLGRGVLTKEVQEISKKHIGREIDLTKLRLIPYVHYVMTNEQRLDPNKITHEERKVLRKWKDAELIEGGASGLGITEEFWNFISDVVFQAYVKREGEECETTAT